MNYKKTDTEDKIVSVEELLPRLSKEWKSSNRIVFTNGCFDILHVGHVRYLNMAKEKGDTLIVGVNSDISMKAIKGQDRPIQPEEYRAELIASLSCVDFVVLFDEPDPLNLIIKINPQVLVKGGDWEEDQIIGANVVKGCGGTVERIPLVEGISTSIIIERIKDPSLTIKTVEKPKAIAKPFERIETNTKAAEKAKPKAAEKAKPKTKAKEKAKAKAKK